MSRFILFFLILSGCAVPQPKTVTADICLLPGKAQDWNFKTYVFIPGGGYVCTDVRLTCFEGKCSQVVSK